MSQTRYKEDFKPIPVHRSEGFLSNLQYKLRLCLDLQLLTCERFLAPKLAVLNGDLLDVGCGEMPFRPLLPQNVNYTGIDVPDAVSFGMRNLPDVIDFDGKVIPFPDNSFDYVMCTEVLEHVDDPKLLINEIQRVLRPGGTLLATIPFSARVHHAPHDYHRFTNYRLAQLFADFNKIEIEARGNDLAVIANKLIVVMIRLSRSNKMASLLWRVPILIFMIPLAIISLIIAHLSLLFQWGSENDPLGYSVRATKR